MRITFWIAAEWNIVLLTVFTKSKRRDAAQVLRARRALWDCRENHVHGQRN